MGLIEALFLAVALAMDCFSVSVTCGILQRRMGAQVWGMAFLFGLFQAAMPLFGWCFADLFRAQIADYDHWVAFALLALLGGKMVREGSRPGEERHYDPSELKVLLTIGLVSFLLTVAGKYVGVRIGRRLDFPAPQLGGVILILIGVKVLLTHLAEGC